MIGSGNNINPYSSHTHDHAVTDCLHDRHQTKTGASGMQSANASSAEPVNQDEEPTVREILLGGLQGLVRKSKGFLARMWYSDSELEAADKKDGAAAREDIAGIDSVKGNKQPTEISVANENVSAGILATSALRPNVEKTGSIEEDAERKVDNIEGAVSGGLKKEESGIRRFLKQFGETITKHSRLLRRKSQGDMKKTLSENNTDFGVGDNSYLLDSYNKSGQYSTLMKDKRTEGNFKARG